MDKQYSIQITVVQVDDKGNNLTNYYDMDYSPIQVDVASVDQSFVEKIANYLAIECDWQIRNHEKRKQLCT